MTLRAFRYAVAKSKNTTLVPTSNQLCMVSENVGGRSFKWVRSMCVPTVYILEVYYPPIPTTIYPQK